MHARTRGRTGKTAGYVCSSGAEGEQRTTGKAVKGGPAYQIPHTARRGGGVAHPFARCDQRDRARFHCPREIRDGLTSFHQQSPISCLFLLQSSISCLFLLLSPMSCMFLLQFHISCLFLLQSPISCLFLLHSPSLVCFSYSPPSLVCFPYSPPSLVSFLAEACTPTQP